ncbi:MAG: LytTR family transcriptional regulator [Bacteroidetes bacterium]|nr:LytTR family transcriptional regulator [Bacteroidota bacterium]
MMVNKQQPWFFIRSNSRYVKVSLKDIVYAEALKNYVRIVTVQRNWLVLLSLKELEKALPFEGFCRVHRSFIVSLEHVQSFDRDTVYMEQANIPIGESYRQEMEKHITLLVKEAGQPVKIVIK